MVPKGGAVVVPLAKTAVIEVFISYSHDSPLHKGRVLEFANRLRAEGIASELDAYHEAPPEGWPRWMLNQVEEARFVLVVCTETYHRRFRGRESVGGGRGAKWEGAVITQELYQGELLNTKFIPILLDPKDVSHVPIILKGTTFYDVSTEAGYTRLYRRLTGQPETEPPSVAEKFRDMPPVNVIAEARLAEAREKLKAAKLEFDHNEFGAAARLSLEAAEFAKSAGDDKVERKALLQAVRALGEHVMSVHLDSDADRAKLISAIHGHIDDLEKLGEAPGAIALERALVARLEENPEDALRMAEAAASLANGDVFILADALIARLQALWQLGKAEAALSLTEQVESVRTAADDDPRLVLDATWLRTLCKAGKATRDDVERFGESVRALQASGKLSRERLALVVNQVELEFGRAGRNEDRLMLCELGYEILEPLRDVRRLTLLSLEAAELSALLGDAELTRKHLGRADSWAAQRRRTTEEEEDSEPTFEAMRLFARGRALARLGDRTEPPAELYEAAHEALNQAMQFAIRNKAAVRGDMELYQADLSWWLGRTAINLGRLEDGAKTLRGARSDAAMNNPRFVSEVAVRAWGLEAEALALSGHLPEAASVVEGLLSDSRIPEPDKSRPRKFQRFLALTVRPTVDWFSSPEASKIRRVCAEHGLRNAVAQQLSPLVSWWKEWQRDGGGPASELMDFWGRGGFSRIAAAVRARAHAAVAVDARSVDEIRKWARVFCPVFDTVIVKWKGELGAGLAIAAIHAAYGDGPDDFGGHGYDVTAGSTFRDHAEWHPALSWANPLPREVPLFLAGEALPLVSAGRLVVLPAPLVGCTQTAIGWTDNLLVETFLGGVVDVVGREDSAASSSRKRRVLDITQVQIPFIDNVDLADLASVLEETEAWIGAFRGLLLKAMSKEDLSYEHWDRVDSLEYDISQACRELREHLESFTRRHPRQEWTVSKTSGGIAAGERDDAPIAREPVTGLLQAVASARGDLAPWIPYLRLQDHGGHLNWTCPLDNPSTPPDAMAAAQLARRGPELQSWLYPGTGGWNIPTAFVP